MRGPVGSFDQAGLLAWGSSSRRSFPSGTRRTVVVVQRSSPHTVAGQRGFLTPFPLGPRWDLIVRQRVCRVGWEVKGRETWVVGYFRFSSVG
jgi:hypothetical protein